MEWISGFTNSFVTSAVRILSRCSVHLKCVLMCVGGRQCVSIIHGWIVGRVRKGVCVFLGMCNILCLCWPLFGYLYIALLKWITSLYESQINTLLWKHLISMIWKLLHWHDFWWWQVRIQINPYVLFSKVCY